MDTTTELLGQSLVCWDTLLGLGHSVGLGYSIAAASTLWANQIGLIKWANQMGLIEWEGGLITNPTGATQWGATGHRSLIHREGD
uniref:Uncharacterized protein n=1 Tax=Picea glauca TaxID=3330 RepID=A0A124GNL5_PICGL|nr:hypothetical protein ABT39_MTgene3755 [Picea glauca]QHR88280.1 hypothetical protein Q903MT_gene2293 [Picea sitchensis]